jgi:nucleoside-specific outer membrane channel protein Tsx
MKKVLLTTTAIAGLTAPAFAADPTAVSDQPYFHHAHPMTWSGAMSIKLTNQSTQDSDKIKEKSGKRDWLFSHLVMLLAKT